jgi:hypothetical protein
VIRIGTAPGPLPDGRGERYYSAFGHRAASISLPCQLSSPSG